MRPHSRGSLEISQRGQPVKGRLSTGWQKQEASQPQEALQASQIPRDERRPLPVVWIDFNSGPDLTKRLVVVLGYARSGLTMLLCSASAAARKRSISACASCFDGLVLAIGDLR